MRIDETEAVEETKQPEKPVFVKKKDRGTVTIGARRKRGGARNVPIPTKGATATNDSDNDEEM